MGTGGSPVSADQRKPITKALTIGVALAFSATLILTANAPVSAHPTKRSMPTLRLELGGINFDDVEGGFAGTFSAVNAGLLQRLPSGKVVPDLATWTVTKNHLVYTFTIRRTARFSNDHYVTAQGAEFSLKRYVGPANPSNPLAFAGLIRGAAAFNAGKTKSLSGVKVLGNRTLQITITKPVAYFLQTLTNFSTVFDPSVLAGKSLGSPDNGFKTNYLDTTCTANQGAGPFKLACRDRSTTRHSFYSGHLPMVTLVPNPYYYGRKPRIRIKEPVFRTELAGYKAYLAGKLDATYLPQSFVNRWKGKSEEYHEFRLGNVDYLVPNVHPAPFNNMHCRLALAYAIDRETLARNIVGGVFRATYAILPPGMLGYYPGKDNPHYDPAKARAELAKCPNRATPFDLKYSAGQSDNEFSAIATMLRSVGMNVSLKRRSLNDWSTAASSPLDASNTLLLASGWNQDYPDPQDFCTILLRSGQQYNVGGWHDAAYDRLVDKAEVTLNRKERVKLYIRAQHLALSQGALISLDNELDFYLIKPYVRGMTGSEAFPWLAPKGNKWSNVSMGKH